MRFDIVDAELLVVVWCKLHSPSPPVTVRPSGGWIAGSTVIGDGHTTGRDAAVHTSVVKILIRVLLG